MKSIFVLAFTVRDSNVVIKCTYMTCHQNYYTALVVDVSTTLIYDHYKCNI